MKWRRGGKLLSKKGYVTRDVINEGALTAYARYSMVRKLCCESCIDSQRIRCHKLYLPSTFPDQKHKKRVSANYKENVWKKNIIRKSTLLDNFGLDPEKHSFPARPNLERQTEKRRFQVQSWFT